MSVSTSCGPSYGAALRSAETALVILLCLPSILGTALIGALILYARAVGEVPPNHLGYFLVVASDWAFMMGVYGPLAIVVATPLALIVTRARRGRRLSVATLWITIALAIIATAVFYQILIWSAPMP